MYKSKINKNCMIINYLKTIYDIPEEAKYLNVLDLVPIYINFDKYQYNLKLLLKLLISNNIKLNPMEQLIMENETSPYRHLIHLIRQNHFTNYYDNLQLILNGINSTSTPNMIIHNTKLIDHIYNKINNISLIHDMIVNIYEQLISGQYPMSDIYDLKKFYTAEMIEKFASTLQFKIPLKFNNNFCKETNIKLKKIYQKLIIESGKTKQFINNLLKHNEFNTNPSVFGLSNFNENLYIFNLKYVCGLNFKSKHDIEYLYHWAKQCLKNNINKTKKIFKKLYKSTDLTTYTHKELINLINNDTQYNFNSEQEFTNAYIQEIDKKYKFIVANDIPLINKCEIATFNNNNSSGGFYMNNCFFLNTSNWQNQKKFEVRPLTMHETYPGHHMQLDISSHHNPNNYLTIFFEDMFITYIEGWALFAEKIHSDNDLASDFGQNDSELLRILRIIADIDLHYWKKTPEEVINYMSEYLALDRQIIVSEVYRYLVLPAQSISYKIGEIIFMQIYYKLKGNSDTKINDPVMIKEYIKILLEGEKSVKELLKTIKTIKPIKQLNQLNN
jgi:hypothetical protein